MKNKVDIDETMGVESGSESLGSDYDDGSEGDIDNEEEAEDQDEESSESNKRKLHDQGGKNVKFAKVKGNSSDLYRPPTMDELNSLRETQMLYHSNLFRLQMEEVLSEVSMKEKHRLLLTQWLTQLSAHLTSLPHSPEYELSQKKWMEKKGVHDAMVETMPEVKGAFLFLPPTKIEYVGSFASGTTTTLNNVIDAMITLPKKCVHAADWQNGRWLTKRVKYLSWVAASLLEKKDIVQNLSWTTHLGVSCRPVLQVTPAGGLGKKWKVNLYPVPPLDCFKVTRFSPERSNLQPNWFFSDDVKVGEDPPASPHYNWACAVDVVMQEHNQLVVDLVGNNTNLAQGIQLIKIWLAQRGLDKGMGSFSGHMVALLVIHLLQTHKISAHMSAYQVFRNTVLTLGSHDWTVKGMNMCLSSQPGRPALDTFHKLYEVVLIDPSGFVNLAASMISADFQRIEHEAQLAISFLNSSSADSFESLFIKKVEMFQMSDQLLSVKLEEKDGQQALHKRESSYLDQKMDFLGDVRTKMWSFMIAVLREGLGERKTLVAPLREAPAVWQVDQPPPQQSWSLVLGFVLDPVAAWSLLTKGPAADSPDVENFKTFWGEKCSLRRFQDGSFHEAVLWGSPKMSVAQRRQIPEKICRDLLSRHFGIENRNILHIAQQTETILHLPQYGMNFKYATGEEATVSAIQAFDSLSRKLRSLDLPLKITSVQPKSDVSRHARVFPPITKELQTSGQVVKEAGDHLQFSGLGGTCTSFNYAMEVIIFLEISGKWPEDLEAIQAIKAEFHSKMCDMLKEESIMSVLFPKFLQILWMGYFFRVQVCYLREIYLQRLVETPEGVWKEQETAAATRLEREIEIIPRLTTAIASVQADHPSFSGGVRLCKRWAASQLLLPHLPSIAVELLVAHLYLSPAPYTPPHTPHAAFLRFLQLLSHTDWKTTPLLVNLNEEFSVEDVAELNRRFTSQRATLPHMFLVTPYDLRPAPSTDTPADLDQRYKLASMWTKSSVSLQILYRSKQLAAAALNYLNASLLTNNMDIKTIFRPSFDDFDATIELTQKELSRCHEAIDWRRKKSSKVKPYQESRKKIMPIVMFDVAQLYLKELKETFGHLALFFYDEHGGQSIGVVWKPHALTPQELKVGSMEGHQPIGVKEVKQVPNIDAILEDFRILGAGLVQNVTVKSS